MSDIKLFAVAGHPGRAAHVSMQDLRPGHVYVNWTFSFHQSFGLPQAGQHSKSPCTCGEWSVIGEWHLHLIELSLRQVEVKRPKH